MKETPLLVTTQSSYLIFAGLVGRLRHLIWLAPFVLVISQFYRIDWPSALLTAGAMILLNFFYKYEISFYSDGIHFRIRHAFLWGRKIRIATWEQINDWKISSAMSRPILLIETTKGSIKISPSGTYKQSRQRVEEARRILSEQYRKTML